MDQFVTVHIHAFLIFCKDLEKCNKHLNILILSTSWKWSVCFSEKMWNLGRKDSFLTCDNWWKWHWGQPQKGERYADAAKGKIGYWGWRFYMETTVLSTFYRKVWQRWPLPSTLWQRKHQAFPAWLINLMTCLKGKNLRSSRHDFSSIPTGKSRLEDRSIALNLHFEGH